MTTVPLYTYKLLNLQNQLEIGLLNHLAQQVCMIFIFNIEFFSTFLKKYTVILGSRSSALYRYYLSSFTIADSQYRKTNKTQQLNRYTDKQTRRKQILYRYCCVV